MTKAQKRTQKAIDAILSATGLSQHAFAEMIGASLDTVKGWKRKKNPSPMSAQFENQILFATGAMIQKNGCVFTHWVAAERPPVESDFLAGLLKHSQPFTRESFSRWRENISKTSEALTNLYANSAAESVRQIFKAAKQPVNGRRNKIPAVWNSFCSWEDETARLFKLSRQLDALPGSRRRKGKREVYISLTDSLTLAGFFSPTNQNTK